MAYSALDTDTYYREIESENAKKMDVAVEKLKRKLPLDASILDIGAGRGLFVRRLYDAGFTDVSAHEISTPESGFSLSSIADIATDLYYDYDYSSVPSDQFDAVTLLDVAEHVPNPKMLFEACARILKPMGLLYLHTPVVTRTDRIMHFVQRLPILGRIGEIWQNGRTSVFHLENYTRRSLTLLLRQSGFDEIHIDLRNELSWPIHLYVRIYFIDKTGMPGFLTPVFSTAFRPLLESRFFNANKAIVVASKLAS